jgi:hypothetical protein
VPDAFIGCIIAAGIEHNEAHCFGFGGSLYERAAPYEELAVTGWGRTADKLTAPLSPVLRVGKVPLISNETCNEPESYGGRVTGTMLCAGFHERRR